MDEQQFEYRTGRTEPEKKHNGIIAVLLILVIFLSGLVSLLGIMNIHLLGKLQQTDSTAPLSFAEGDLTPAAPEGNSLTVGGITLQEQSAIYQQLYDLPQGLFVVSTDTDGAVIPGDVLISFDKSPIGTLDELNSLYQTYEAGTRIELIFYRQGEYFTHTVTLD